MGIPPEGLPELPRIMLRSTLYVKCQARQNVKRKEKMYNITMSLRVFPLHFILYTLVLTRNQKGGFYGTTVINHGGDTNSNTIDES